MASRHPVFTAAQVGGLLDEFIFSGSDDDFDVSADDDYDPLEREQGNHDHNR